MRTLPAIRAVRTLAAALIVIVSLARAVRADVVFALNEAMLQFSAVPSRAVAPFLEVRVFAVAHLAMDEAIAAATRSSDAVENRLGAQRAAAVTAAQAVVAELAPAWSKSFAAVAERYLGAVANGPDKSRGMAAGQLAAARVLQRRARDGWTGLVLLNPPIGPLPDASPGAANALAAGDPAPRSPWLKATPFALKSAHQFHTAELRTMRHDATVALDVSLHHSKLFDDVDRIAAADTAERFWRQRPVVAWNRIARQICVGRSVDVAGQARLLATLNLTLGDAMLSALHWRHTIGSWRSIWAELWQPLHGAPPRPTDVVARADNGFLSELVQLEMQRVLIPPTPNYPSVSATLAGAAQAAITQYFGDDALEFRLPDLERSAVGEAKANAPRVFATVAAAARESAFVASLDGQHCREACIAGYRLGDSIGGYIGKRVARRGSKVSP